MQINNTPQGNGAFTLVPKTPNNNSQSLSLPDDGSPAAATAAATAAPFATPDGVPLTPDSLMAYCQSRLDSLDNQMNDIFASQQSNSKTTKDISSIASALNDLPMTTGNPSPPTVDLAAGDAQHIRALYDEAIKDAGANTPLGQELTSQKNTFMNEAGNCTTMRSDEVSLLTTNLKNYSANLNSDSELSMINLQSLMSQRQTAVQLTTNLVQALGQQSSDITKNVGA